MNLLKQQKIWLCYRQEDSGGRKTKVPYSALDRCKVGTNKENEHRWTTYAQAKKVADNGNLSGVGFVLTSGLCAIDIDHRELDSDFVQEILDGFDTYIEISPSGKGAHIYFYV